MVKLTSTNPAKNYEIVGSINISTAEEIEKKVTAAQKVKTAWKKLGIAKRTKLLWPVHERLLKGRKEIRDIVIKETGKAKDDVESEMDRYAKTFRWFLENGEKSLADEITYEDGKSVHKIIYEPLGVTAVIIPWNQPYGMFVWGVIPNLIAGNPVILKHSEECPLTGRLIEKLVNDCRLPPGVFSEIYGDGRIGEMLLRQNIDLIWFTGSSKAGKAIYKIAADKFIKVVLEMGGSNPGIIFDDADVDKFIDKIYTKRFRNCGQTCDALKRLIVHRSLFDEVVEKIKRVVETKIVGDPENSKTDIGSLVAQRQLDLLEAQVNDAVKKGAKVITGGKRPMGLKGAYYLPTILTNIKRNMRVWQEETFGPVLAIVPFKTEKEAVELANDSKYGLGSLIFTKDSKRALRVASQIQSGTVEINNANHWLACNPFGGYKESGMGREHGKHGFQELTQIKVVSSEK
ncbi:MAG: aldehyde dehydrogenase family protein [bacterium]|nr:aldehyde dehydrogenase family protein [bacterium]